MIGKSLSQMWTDFLKHLPLIFVALVVIVITWIAANITTHIISSVTRRSRLRGGLQYLIRQLAVCAIWVLGLMIAAVVMFPGMTPAKVLTVLGLGSAAIGFAFKDIFENFFAGVLILVTSPPEMQLGNHTREAPRQILGYSPTKS